MLAGEAPPRGRAWVLRILSVLVGLAGVAVVELSLRALPGLGPPPLVTTLAEQGGRTLRSIEPLYARRFFTQRHRGALLASGRMAPTPFVEAADHRPLRIVFVGESTVQGYPHPRRLAAASFLEAMLNAAGPVRPVQVINLGITSIGSWAVARVLEDALQQLRPDLAVVYCGHNEFYGLFGAGSGSLPGLEAARYRLGQLRLAGLMERAAAAVRGDSVLSQSLLESMSARGRVDLHSPRRQRAVRGLSHSLHDMASSCARWGVPLIVCTLAANDSGFAPAAVPQPPSPQWGARRQELFAAAAAGLPPAAAAAVLAAADSLLADAPEDALLHYAAGCAAAAAGQLGRSTAAFERAKDLDLMPWRAPAAHNLAIRRVVADAPGVVLADVAAAFAADAGGRGVGWALMSDHVHPSVHGQAVLARCLLETVAAAMPQWTVDPGRGRDETHYRRLLGDLPVERVGLDQAMSELLGSPPLDRYNAHSAARLARQAQAGWAALSPAEQRGARRWPAHRDQVPLALEVADELFAAGDLERAALHYAASRLEAPFTPRGDLWAAVQWGWALRLSGGALSAQQRGTLEAALDRTAFVALGPGMDPGFIAMVRGVLLHFLQRHDQALPQLEDAFARAHIRQQFAYTLFPALAAELVAAGRLDAARQQAGVAAAADGNPYFAQLVETLAAGGRLGPPH